MFLSLENVQDLTQSGAFSDRNQTHPALVREGFGGRGW